MKQYIIHICYQTRDNKNMPIREIDLVAHSIQDAKSAFSLWQHNTYPENIINGGKHKFKIIAAAKLAEVVAPEAKKEWLRLHPEQIKNLFYICPNCQSTVCTSSINGGYTEIEAWCKCGRKIK